MPPPATQRTPSTPNQLQTAAGRVCVALSGPTMLQDAAAALPTCHFLEFRLDSVPDPAALLPALHDFLAGHADVTAIATCRRTGFGGGYGGNASEQLRILQAAALAGCRLVDAEVETAQELGPEALTALRRTGAAVILSWHDFTGTPNLEAIYQRLARLQPDLIKIVPTAQSLTDSILLIDLLETYGNTGRLVAMSMGQPGVLTRVLGPRYGSAFTFASPDSHTATAPGQVPADMLLDLYRINNISERTALYAVAGKPIAASLSPLMHNTAFREAGIDAVYLPLETADAAELMLVSNRLGIRGLSITMPLKETVLPHLAERDALVDTMGACNTLLRLPNGTFGGFNTDVAGITGPLEAVFPLAGKRVLVLGAGGAARAAIFGLCAKGAQVSVLNRTWQRAAALAQEAGAQVQAREALAAEHFDVIINTTPYGMQGKLADPPITSEEMHCSLFFDLVYNPIETPLILLAKQRGIQTILGAAMFVAQGVEQFLLWTGLDAAGPDAAEQAMLSAVSMALLKPSHVQAG